MKAVSTNDFRTLAKKRLPPFLFEYIDGGSYSETTLARNTADLEALALRQRVLRDVSQIDTNCTLFGVNYDMPIALAPVGLAGMNARRGEVQAVRASNAANVPFTLSTVSVCPLSEVRQAADKDFWFQLYIIKDRAFMRDLIAQAKEAKCSALVFTVDIPVPGARYRDYHSGLAGASGFLGSLRRAAQAAIHPRWAIDVGLLGRPHHLGNVAPVLKGNTGLEDFFAWMRSNFDPAISWKDMDFIRSEWDGPLVIKGIMDPADAVETVKTGVDGIVVSNHGGRQLDGVPSSTTALPAIAEKVKGDITLMADSGIRSGLDVVKMLALGADGVMIGRAWAYALAAGGENAITDMLNIFSAEMRIAMALTGATSINTITQDILA